MPRPDNMVVDAFLDSGGVVGSNSTSYVYQDPRRVTTDGGVPLSNLMPGLTRGVVIPNGREDGASYGWDPQAPPHRQIEIDPHMPGQRVVIDQSLLTPENTKAAAEAAKRLQVPLTGLARDRFLGSAAYHMLGGQGITVDAAADTVSPAEADNAQVGSRHAAVMQPSQPIKFVPSTVKVGSAMQQVAPGARRSSLMANFTNPPVTPGQPAPIMGNQSAPVVAAPDRHVTFEIPHFGQHESWYHDVIISGATLVLVCSDSYRGAKYFPTNAQEKLALSIDGDDNVYLCLATGATFQHGGYSYGILFIADTRSTRGAGPPQAQSNWPGLMPADDTAPPENWLGTPDAQMG